MLAAKREKIVFPFYKPMSKFLLFIWMLIFASSISVSVAEGTEIILSKTIDVPDRTVSYENQTFEIKEIGSYKTNQDIGFTVDAPGVDDMLIVLYDKDKLSTWFKRFYNTSGRVAGVIPANKTGEAGTYALTVSHGTNIIEAIPVVISDYDLSVIPKSNKVIAGNGFDVEVAISRDGVPVNVDNTVKVVLSKGSSSFETNASSTKTGAYEAHIEIPQAANGTFSLYSVIATERKVFMNYPEILAIASGGDIEIAPPSAGEKMPFVGGAVTLLILLGMALFIKKKL